MSAAPAAQGFPKCARLRRRPDFLVVQDSGRRVSGPRFLLLVAPRRAPALETVLPSRFGFTVSRKVGGAVQRNQLKRWLRNAVRCLRLDLPAGQDFVVIAKPASAAPTVTGSLIANDLRDLFRRIGSLR